MTTAELPIVTEPWQAAVERLAGKTPVATRLNNEEWSRLPLAVRERAIWSATLAQADVIQQIKDDLIAMKSMQTVDGRAMDRSRIIARARQTLGALPGDTDDLTDLTSFRRLQLIVDFQEQDANGYARVKTDLEDPDILDAEPAYRFTRIEQRDSERLDWPMRWAAAYARVGGQGALRSPMVALKTSPIWAALSRFGRPWPPFDFGSGMGLEGVDRFEAEDLGLLSPDDTLDGGQAIRDFNDGVEASAKNLDPQTRSWVDSAIGDIAQFIGDKSVLRAAPSPSRASTTPAQAGTSTPAGTPIGVHAFDFSPAGPERPLSKRDQATIREAIQAIDKTHGDGPLDARLVAKKVQRGTLGTFWPTSQRIGVRPSKTPGEMEHVFYHEFGHRLDWAAIGPRGRDATAAGAVDEILRAIKHSQAYKALDNISNPGYRSYLQRDDELFARAYAQYITEENGSADARAYLQRKTTPRTNDPTQWNTDDFAPIKLAFKETFKQLGWIR